MLAVLLAVGGVAVARARQDAARPRPAPTPAVTATARPEPSGDDTFAHVTVVERPEGNDVEDALLYEGVPAFVLRNGGIPWAVAALGGPQHARVLVGWCAPSRSFQDATGTFRYDSFGSPRQGAGDPMPWHRTRANGVDLIEIAWRGEPAPDLAGAGEEAPVPGRCPVPLRFPRLPARAANVHDTIHGYRLVSGRFVVSTDATSFCAPVTATGCATQGWEAYRLGSLPPQDLAGSYTWEGEFLVRGDSDGSLRAVRLPRARLVSRTAVGRTAVLGVVDDLPARNPMRVAARVMARYDDARGLRAAAGHEDIVVRDDAAVFIGLGRTGLGLPPGTVDTLYEFLATRSVAPSTFWFVLDARGQAIRVVIR